MSTNFGDQNPLVLHLFLIPEDGGDVVAAREGGARRRLQHRPALLLRKTGQQQCSKTMKAARNSHEIIVLMIV